MVGHSKVNQTQVRDHLSHPLQVGEGLSCRGWITWKWRDHVVPAACYVIVKARLFCVARFDVSPANCVQIGHLQILIRPFYVIYKQYSEEYCSLALKWKWKTYSPHYCNMCGWAWELFLLDNRKIIFVQMYISHHLYLVPVTIYLFCLIMLRKGIAIMR